MAILAHSKTHTIPKYERIAYSDKQITTIRNLKDIGKIDSVWNQMQHRESCPVPNADYERYIAGIKTQGEDAQPYIILIEQNNKPMAMVIGRIEKHSLKIKFGYKTLYTANLKRLAIVYGGVLGEVSDDTCAIIIRELTNSLKQKEADYIYFNHLKVDSSIYKAVRRIPNYLCRTHFPETKPHSKLIVPGDMDKFYKMFNPHHRKNLKRLVRRLDKAYPERVKRITYSTQSQLDEAINAMSQISSKTYQRALGCGFLGDAITGSLLEVEARRGQLRADVLYVDNEPAAYDLKVMYGRTLFGETKGFDPKWRKYSVGTVLFLKFIEDVCKDPTVESLDFGFGYAEYKEHYANQGWTEASLEIFAPRLYPIVINMLLSTTRGLSLATKYLLNKTTLTRRIKRQWRNVLQAKNTCEEKE